LRIEQPDPKITQRKAKTEKPPQEDTDHRQHLFPHPNYQPEKKTQTSILINPHVPNEKIKNPTVTSHPKHYYFLKKKK